MKRYTLVLFPPLLVWLAGCASNPPPHTSPFKVSKEEIRKRVTIVAVAPLPVDNDVPNDSQVREEFANSIVTELNSLGFQTVAPADYEEIFNRLRDEAGGFFDPMTGKGDKDKYTKVMDLCRHELATKYHADAVLFSSLESFTVPFHNDYARWDGVSENVADSTWVERAFGVSHYGNAPAASLCVALVDIEGNRLFSKCGGIQLLAKANTGGFKNVPNSKILTDPQKNTRAVQIALEALRKETEEPAAPKKQ
jgi:hypothetical protein